MANLGNFNANNVEPSRNFEPIPAGKYLAVITASEMKANKAGTGRYLELTFTIMDGEHKGRLLWGIYNLENPSDVAVKIAKSELADLCRAVGVMVPQDSMALHNLPLIIKVQCKKRKDNDEIVNSIKGYAKREAGGGQPQQANTATPPWQRAKS